MKRSFLQWAFTAIFLVWNTARANAVDFVKNGKACGEIIVSTQSAVNKAAAKDLQYHIEKISGVKLSIGNQKIGSKSAGIYLGKNDGAELDSLGRNGFAIRTEGNDLIISGKGDGVLEGVYWLLENELGCRWLWPGETGEIIPKKDTISLDVNIRFKQPIESSRIHMSVGNGTNWNSKANHKAFYSAANDWLRRMGFSWNTEIRSQHSFGHPGWRYGYKYMKTHPEYFNMLPDGTRRPNPYYVNGAVEFTSICPSSEGLLKQVLSDWEANRKKGYPWGPNLYLGENDVCGSCCCELCLAADHSDDPERLNRAKERFGKGDPKWVMELGQVADRYAPFYLKGLEAAKKIDPSVRVVGWAAYANYMEAPKHTRFNKDIVLCFVGQLMYPWTPEKMKKFKRLWQDWSNTGAKLVLRPNFMLDGHCMPINFARKLYDIYHFCLDHNMIGVEYDSNIGQYAANGFNYYVMARMIRSPQLSFETIKKEYCDAFGNASGDISDYLDLCEKISDSPETVKANATVRRNPVGAEVGSWNYFYTKAPIVYTQEVMAQLSVILKKAALHARGNQNAEKRVIFLQNGLRNSELTLAAQRAYESGDKMKLAEAVMQLDSFRDKIEPDLGFDRQHLVQWEDVCWDRTSLRFMMNAPGVRISETWKLKFDPDDKGIEEGWFKKDFPDSDWSSVQVGCGWESQPPGIAWNKEHKGTDYDGIGWYRTIFTVKPEDQGRKAVITFGAVDEACELWINGKKMLDRPYPYQGDINSWALPFAVDITEAVVPGVNTIAIRVVDTAGQGGIWRPVWIKFSNLYPENKNPNLLINGDFEGNRKWGKHRVHGKFNSGFTTRMVRSGSRAGFLECVEINPRGRNLFEYAWMRFFQNVKVKPGKYFFRVFYKTDHFEGKGQVRVWLLGKNVKYEFTGGPANTNWFEVVFPEIVVPQGTNEITVYLNVLGGTGIAVFDDAELKAL